MRKINSTIDQEKDLISHLPIPYIYKLNNDEVF